MRRSRVSNLARKRLPDRWPALQGRGPAGRDEDRGTAPAARLPGHRHQEGRHDVGRQLAGPAPAGGADVPAVPAPQEPALLRHQLPPRRVVVPLALPDPRHGRGTRRRGPFRVGEASPYYMFHPAAADRIADRAGRPAGRGAARTGVARPLQLLRPGRGRNGDAADVRGSDRGRGVAPHRGDRRVAGDPGHYSFSHDHHTYLARDGSRAAAPLLRSARPRTSCWCCRWRRSSASPTRRSADRGPPRSGPPRRRARGAQREAGNPAIDPATRERLSAAPSR